MMAHRQHIVSSETFVGCLGYGGGQKNQFEKFRLMSQQKLA
jgi:hypothetical protein